MNPDNIDCFFKTPVLESYRNNFDENLGKFPCLSHIQKLLLSENKLSTTHIEELTAMPDFKTTFFAECIPSGSNLLRKAICHSQKEVILKIIEIGTPSILNYGVITPLKIENESLLVFSIRYERYKITKLLIENNIEVNTLSVSIGEAGEFCQSPLYYAIDRYKNLEDEYNKKNKSKKLLKKMQELKENIKLMIRKGALAYPELQQTHQEILNSICEEIKPICTKSARSPISPQTQST